ncbi:unnamed protein product, partial [Rotaria socialis]
MLLDTEGLLGKERGNKEYDRRLILFCLAVSHLVIVNVTGDAHDPLVDMLILCADSRQKLGVTTVHRPPVHIVLNQRTNLDVNTNNAFIDTIMLELKKKKLDQQIEFNHTTVHALPLAFSQEYFSVGETEPTLLHTNPLFIEKVQCLCRQLVSTAATSLQQAGAQLSDPVLWLKFAATVLDVLRKFPDMTYFKDIYESKQFDSMHEWIREELNATFTKELRIQLNNQPAETTMEETKTIFSRKFAASEKTLSEKLQKELLNKGVANAVRERSETFLKGQISSIFHAWTESALMNNERQRLNKLVKEDTDEFHKRIQATIEAIRKKEWDKLKTLVPKIDDQFLNAIKQNIINTSRLSADHAGSIFDKIWDEAYPLTAAGFDHKKQANLSLGFVYKNYHMYEKSHLPDMWDLIPLLCCIPQSVEAQNDNDMQIFEKIQNECILRMSDHSPIEEIPFKYDNTAVYTRRTIEELKYVDADTLLMACNTYHQNRMTEIWSREFHLHLRQFILNKISAKSSHCAQSGIGKELLPVRKSLDELLKTMKKSLDVLLKTIKKIVILEEAGARPQKVDTELVKHIVGIIFNHCKEINNELDVFKLTVSRQYLAMMHKYTVLILTKFYYDEQRRAYDDTLSK